MSAIWNAFCSLLGYIMKFCYDIIGVYGLAIIVFTFLTKIIMLPISIFVQKNSVKMIKMKPELDALKYQYIDDKDGLLEAQNALYKKEKYSPFASMIPLALQIPLIFGLLDVIYNPLTHILHISSDVISKFEEFICNIENISLDALSQPELAVLRYAQNPTYAPQMEAISKSDFATLQTLNTSFLGIDLSAIPTLTVNLLILIPLIAGLSAFIMCYFQNKVNVLQLEQGFVGRWGTTIVMVAISTFFAVTVPAGVGIYWTFGNLFAIPVMYLMNVIYDPKKYIDYKTLGMLKEKAKQDHETEKQNAKLSKKYYKEITKDEIIQKMELVFYSEQSGFYKYFENIINGILENSDITIYYITSDPNDKIFQKNNPRIIPYYISGNQLISLMMRLDCKMVVMTTPDLEKYHIKRSRVNKKIEYVYTEHGCSSMNLTYRTGALDYFDTIFAVSRTQALEIRAMEELRKTHKKRIVKVGYGLIDNMIENYQKSDIAKNDVKNERPTVLIAPSWQYDNIMDSCLDDILSSLVCDKYKVIVRPHPQYIKRFPVKMDEIIEKYKDKFSEYFEIQTDFSSNSTVYSSDILITDWSGIAFEFSFTTNKPSLFINTQMKVVNKDYNRITITPFDIEGRDQVGISINKEDCINISSTVDDLLEHYEDYTAQIDALKNSYFYNLGHSGEVGADYIIKRIKGIPFNSTGTTQNNCSDMPKNN